MLFDMIIFGFNGEKKQYLGHNFQWAIIIWNNRLPRIITFPQIIALFLCKKRNNHPQLLFEEIR